MKIVDIGLERLRPGLWQPRDREQITDESVAELAADIRRRGLLNPLIVTPSGEQGDAAIFDIVAGERRWRAAKVAKTGSVAVRIVTGDDEALREMAIVDNLQRKDLTLLEEAKALEALQKLHGYSQRQLAAHVSKSQAWVQQRLALLRVSPKVRELANTRVFSLAHVRALSGLPGQVQEVAATHLDALQIKGVPITSRQVEGVGRRIKAFLNPDKFENAEKVALDPKMRNAMVATRWLLTNQPEETLSRAVRKLLSGDSYCTELCGKRTFKYLDDVTALVRLLYAPENGVQRYDRSEWWTEELALATGRTCVTCIFGDKAAPEEVFGRWRPPCERWEDDARPTSCTKCILPTDEIDIHLEMSHQFETTGSAHAKSVEEVYLRLAETVAHLKQEDLVRADEKVNWSSKRLAAFVEHCRQADDADDCPLDVTHFQAQWCGRCTEAAGMDCIYIDRPIGEPWQKRPTLHALVQVEECLDNDEKLFWMPTRIVPRCEMFILRPSLLAVSPTGFCTFPQDRRGRKATVMRWLHHLLGSGQHSYASAIWSTLRWLPYERGREKHFDRKKLTQYLLNSWDELKDARMATLMNAAASEKAAMESSTDRKLLHNPETGEDEWWIPIRWSQYIDKDKPYHWPDKIDWPFDC